MDQEESLGNCVQIEFWSVYLKYKIGPMSNGRFGDVLCYLLSCSFLTCSYLRSLFDLT